MRAEEGSVLHLYCKTCFPGDGSDLVLQSGVDMRGGTTPVATKDMRGDRGVEGGCRTAWTDGLGMQLREREAKAEG